MGLLFLTVAACASTPAAPPDALAGICQFKPCACTQWSGSVFTPSKTIPVQYGEHGEAMCPAGFSLRQSEPKQGGIKDYN